MKQRFQLVYQPTRATVFKIVGQSKIIILQANNYSDCEMFVRGAREAGATVTGFKCDDGNVSQLPWEPITKPPAESPRADTFAPTFETPQKRNNR